MSHIKTDFSLFIVCHTRFNNNNKVYISRSKHKFNDNNKIKFHRVKSIKILTVFLKSSQNKNPNPNPSSSPHQDEMCCPMDRLENKKKENGKNPNLPLIFDIRK